jgi:hypothetical protein
MAIQRNVQWPMTKTMQVASVPEPRRVQGRTGEGASEEEELAPFTQSMLVVEIPAVRRNYDFLILSESDLYKHYERTAYKYWGHG